jgi:hypothetical protein
MQFAEFVFPHIISQFWHLCLMTSQQGTSSCRVITLFCRLHSHYLLLTSNICIHIKIIHGKYVYSIVLVFWFFSETFLCRIWDFKASPDPLETVKHHSEFVYGLDFNNHVAGQIADCGWDSLVHVFSPRSLMSLSSALLPTVK